MASEALLLTSDGLSGPDLRIGKLLEFFGVSWQAATIQQFISGELTEVAQTPQLICSSEIFLELATRAANSGNSSRPWHKSVGSVFVYGQGNSAGLQRLLRTLMGSDAITVTEENNCARDFG